MDSYSSLMPVVQIELLNLITTYLTDSYASSNCDTAVAEGVFHWLKLCF